MVVKAKMMDRVSASLSRVGVERRAPKKGRPSKAIINDSDIFFYLSLPLE
jgi:hypothetical protein